MELNYKLIINPSVARKLLHMGNEIKDIKPNKDNKRETIFVFEDTDKLKSDLTLITNNNN